MPCAHSWDLLGWVVAQLQELNNLYSVSFGANFLLLCLDVCRRVMESGFSITHPKLLITAK